MKTIIKLSFVLAAVLSLALAGNASARDGGHSGGFGGHGHGGYYGHGGYWGHGYYRGGVLFGAGFYPGYWGYPYEYGYPYYPYPYAYPPPYYPDAYRGRVVDGASARDSMEAQVQQALAEKGYYRGQIDGVIGPASREAIRNYQHDKGLSTTGRINSGLVKSLDLD